MNKKMAAMFATTLIALSIVGVAYAQWTETLFIVGTVDTGEVNAYFTEASSNDPGITEDPGYTMHVGTTEVTGAKTKTLTVTITNGYPCYTSRIAFTIDNIGTIPVKIKSIVLDPDPSPYVTVTHGGIVVGDVIDAGSSKAGWLDIHVTTDAIELDHYSFTVTIVVIQWNLS